MYNGKKFDDRVVYTSWAMEAQDCQIKYSCAKLNIHVTITELIN